MSFSAYVESQIPVLLSLSMHYKASFLGTPVLKTDKCFLALSLCNTQVHLSGFECIWHEWKDRNLIRAQINQIQYGISKALQKKSMNTDWGMVMFLAQCLVFPLCSLTELLQQLPQGKWEIWKSESQNYLLKLVNVRVFPLLLTPYPTHQLYWTVGGSS